MSTEMRLARCALVMSIVGAAACYDFHLAGPEDPPPVPATQLVRVAIEYRQPPGCENAPERCPDQVVFFASWMRPQAEFPLVRDPVGYIWRGTAFAVPVNYPPREDPHFVRIFDPHLVATPTEGFTADRLIVGRETVREFDSHGTPREAGLIYIDLNGEGHNP